MYRFVLRGRWLTGTIIVILLAAVFIRLGLWQLSRLHDRRERNARIEARLAEPVLPLTAVIAADAGGDAVDAVIDRRVRATGTYDPAAQVLVRNRTNDGVPGRWVLTPLRLGSGAVLVVNRGFVAQDDRVPAPPAGRVTVTGLLEPPQRRGTFGAKDPATGTLREINRIDLGRLQRQSDADLFPVWLQLESEQPKPAGAVPAVLPPPELGEGPHFSYAMQWFGFTLVGIVGWLALVRREAVDRARRARPDQPR